MKLGGGAGECKQEDNQGKHNRLQLADLSKDETMPLNTYSM